MRHCTPCSGLGYCKKQTSFEVTDDELTPEFERDGRDFARAHLEGLDISPEQVPHLLVSYYRTYRGRICQRPRRNERISPDELKEVFLDTGLLFERAKNADGSLDEDTDVSPRTYYRDMFFRPCPERPRSSHRARMRVVLSILRARFPDAAFGWGLRPANDA